MYKRSKCCISNILIYRLIENIGNFLLKWLQNIPFAPIKNSFTYLNNNVYRFDIAVKNIFKFKLCSIWKEFSLQFWHKLRKCSILNVLLPIISDRFILLATTKSGLVDVMRCLVVESCQLNCFVDHMTSGLLSAACFTVSLGLQRMTKEL